MPIVVHVTDEKRAASILRGGIRLPKIRKAVYFMPVVQSHFISHQWIRELRREGAKVLVGVYMRLPNQEPVWAGRYNEPHRRVTLGEAIAELRSLADPLGYEVFVDRRIAASEIQKIRSLPQNVGWRYMPHAHGRALCGCPVCLPRGAMKSAKLRERLEPGTKIPSLPEVKAGLLQNPDEDDITELLWALRQKRRRCNPEFLEALLSSKSKSVREDVALTLPFFRHARSRELLRVLARDEDPNVAQIGEEGLRRWGTTSANDPGPSPG